MMKDVPPPHNDLRPDSPARRIDAACDRFEAAWRAGQEARIEDFLVGASAAERPALLRELIALEVELRRGRGEDPKPAEYGDRFSGQAALVDAAFTESALRREIHRPRPSPTRDDTSRSLLLGLLALQSNFIDRDALLTAFATWLADRSRSLGQILLDRSALPPSRHMFLEVLVAEHLKLHDDDPEKSLAALSSIGSVRRDLDQLGDPDLQASLASFNPRAAAEGGDVHATTRLERLGDYRILREVGRGGMGVVYEAEQESLGRRVALKVLPDAALSDARQVLRFQREARAAARLHHTNIVPVFGVGRDDGHHYYVMQFIPGMGLDAVLEELRRLRRGGGTSGPPAWRAFSNGSVSAAAVAEAILTGRFALPEAIDGPPRPGATLTITASASLVPPASPAPRPAESSVVSLPGASADSLARSDPDRTFFRSVARIGLQVAEALEYANRQGVLHRDVKPSNLLLDPQGNVWVADFGLAKAADAEDLTHSGDIVGTVRYMAPERFRGKCDARSDVYALGLTLYELLTLQPAFAAADRHELMRRVMSEEPERLRGLVPHLPRDLETIVTRAIAREPAERYASAAALAEDLQRFLEDRPTRARRVGRVEQAWRLARRNKVVSSLAVSLLLALAGGLAGVMWQWRQAVANLAIAKQRSREATETASTLEQELYYNRVNLAHREWSLDNVALADRLLDQCPLHLRGCEWSYCKRLCHMDRLTLLAPPDDPASAASSLKGIYGLAFSPDGRRLSSAGADFSLTIWDASTGNQLQMLRGHHDVVLALAYSPDGRVIASGSNDQTIRLWDSATGRGLRTLSQAGRSVFSLAFSPDGTRIVTGSGSESERWRSEIRIWDVASGQPIRTWRAHEFQVRCVAWSPDGRRIASAGFGGEIKVWDPISGASVTTMVGHTHAVLGVAFSPDGRRLASASPDRRLILWDAETGQLLQRVPGHVGWTQAVTFHPDGRTLASTGGDNFIRLWDIAEGRERAVIRGHTGPINVIRFSPDGSELASAGEDGMIKVWDVAAVEESESRSLTTYHGWAHAASYSGDGRTLATAGFSGVSLWDSASGRRIRDLDAPMCRAVALSPDGRALAADGGWGIGVWEVATGRWLRSLLADPYTSRPQSGFGAALAFRPDGRELISGRHDGILRVWDVTEGRELHSLRGHTAGINSIAYSPDGRTFASLGWDGKARIWDATSLRELAVLDVPQHYSDRFGNALAFSPDGRHLGAGGDDATVTIWDVASGRHLLTLRGHTQQVNAVAYLDASRIVSSSEDATIRLWNTVTGENIFTLRGHGRGVIGLACRPDGQQIASASVDRTIRLWDMLPPTPEAIRQRHLDALRREAEEALLKRRWSEAIRVLDSVVKSELPSAPDLDSRARALAEAGRAEEALADLNRAAELSTPRPESWLAVGRILTPQGRLQRAEEALRRAASQELRRPALVPTDLALALDDLSAAREARGDNEGALRSCGLAVDVLRRKGRMASHDQNIQHQLAAALVRLGHLRLHSSPHEARVELGEAIVILEKLADPSPADLHNLAVGYAVNSLLAGQGAESIPPAHPAQRSNLADRAMITLRRSIDAGFRDLSHLRQCSLLEPIRSRADVRDLLLDLSFPSQPFAEEPPISYVP
ncbi:protein kinase domain-containing protein (plasmid) [Tundrisphaera lichenicola]|uniref:protein kinase domain-containing protein n=1 Tax=Tundrisphaera lichenicola TaxID=2029860 RepID=UPI003EB7068D